VVCRDLGEKYFKIELDVVTCWNSTWDMLNRVLQLRSPISELLQRIEGRYMRFTELSIAPGIRLSNLLNMKYGIY